MSLRLRIWVILFFVLSTAYMTLYVTVQQVYRQNANDPQIELAEDNAAHFSKNPTIPPPTNELVDMEKSLAPFIIIYSSKYKPVFSTATLNGQVPTPPTGAFEYAKSHSENRITWEPEIGVRHAAVIVSYEGQGRNGYILVGRSLREVEIREGTLSRDVLVAWLITLGVSLVACFTFLKDPKKQIDKPAPNRKK